MIRKFHRETAQAVVEFALAATLIFFLLAAAVDLGLIFFALQGLNNAAQEGANYGSGPGVVYRQQGGGIQIAVLDEPGIVDRVRKEAGGTRGGIGFVNLLDLNNNGTPDVTGGGAEPTVGASGASYEVLGGTTVISDFIRVRAVADTALTGQVTTASPDCGDISRSIYPCYVLVQVSYNYRPVFPLAPVIGNGQLRITSSYFLAMRSSISQGNTNTTPVITKMCVLPNFVFTPAMSKSGAQTTWANLNPPFTSTLKFTGTGNNVKSQSPAPGVYPCSTTVTLTVGN
jgi:hypothetical protein